MTDWQPIETALHTEDTIIVFCPYEGIGCVAWYGPKNHHRGGWVPVAFGRFDFESPVEVRPTHWKPFPQDEPDLPK